MHEENQKGEGRSCQKLTLLLAQYIGPIYTNLANAPCNATHTYIQEKNKDRNKEKQNRDRRRRQEERVQFNMIISNCFVLIIIISN